MELTVTDIDMETKAPIVLLNRADAEELGVHPLDRVEIQVDGEQKIGIVDITDELVDDGELGVTNRLSYINGSVTVSVAPKPDAVRFIKQKLDDEELEPDELKTIIEDIHENRLNDVELGAYVSGIYTNGLSIAETTALTESMTGVGDRIEWNDDIIADKHSIGGVAGNRVTPIVVPIIAAAGVKIPKTSSRAITSPAGTADTMEVLCNVDLSLEEIREIVDETNGVMAWGGSVDLSPVDDQIIRAENPLSLDPPGQVIASVLSKKNSAGSNHVVIDIPYGEGSKVENLPDARDLAHRFKTIGEKLGMKLSCTITRGSEPIGDGIGPILECRDILTVLQGDGPEDLKLKSLRLADVLLELCGKEQNARELLNSGAAYDKFKEIIAAQDGDPDVQPEDLEPGSEQTDVRADRDGVVTHISNELISEVARRAGAPKDDGAGIYLWKGVGDEVEKGDRLFTIYAEKGDKLADAERVEDATEAVRVRSREESLVEQV